MPLNYNWFHNKLLKEWQMTYRIIASDIEQNSPKNCL